MTDEQAATLRFLREQCPAFAQLEQEVIQFVVDQLAAADCLIEAKIGGKTRFMWTEVFIDDLRKLQEIHKAVMERVRAKHGE
jgi:hypothetical protein